MRKALFFYVFLTLMLFPLSAQQSPNFSLDDSIQLNPKVTKGQLPNGFTYYILPNAYPKKKLELRLVVNAGSMQETDKQQGLAHFMEHMNFNGSAHFKKNELVHYLQSIGLKFGADLNAFTTFDKTVYILPIPTKKPEYVAQGFKIMGDWAHKALLLEQDINAERNIILEESRSTKGAQKKYLDSLIHLLYGGTIIAERMPIGKDELIRNFPPEELRAFHKDWYRPDLEALIVVGDIEVAQAEKYIKENFSDWAMPTAPKATPTIAPEEVKENRSMIFSDKEQPYPVFMLFFPALPQKTGHTLADYKADIIQNLITMAFLMRNQELAQNPSAPFVGYQISIGDDGIIRHHKRLTATCLIKNDFKQGVLGLITELKKAANFGFTASELEVAKNMFMEQAESAYKERNKTESGKLLNDLINHYLTQEPYVDIAQEYEYIKYLLPLITPDDLHQELKKYLQNPHFKAMASLPQNRRKEAPEHAEELTQLVSLLWESASVMKQEEEQIKKQLIDKTPPPGTITNMQEDKAFGATAFTLSNGMKVILKTTQFKDDQILFNLVAKGGGNNFPAADKYNMRYLGLVIESMGYGDFTPTQLTKTLSGKTVGLIPYISGLTHGFQGSCSPKYLKTFFELLYLQRHQPRKDDKLFSAFVQNGQAESKNTLDNPIRAFTDTFYKYTYQNHPYALSSVEQPKYFSAIDAQRCLDIYRELFRELKGATLFVVGNIGKDTLQHYLETYLAGDTHQNTELLSFKDNGMRPLTNNTSFAFHKGAEKKSVIVWRFTKELPYTEKKALTMNLLSSMLNMQLIDEVREKHSLVYSIGAFGSLEKNPYEHFEVDISAPCNPDNVGRIEEEIWKEIHRLKVSKKQLNDYLKKAKSQYLEQLRVAKERNGFWLNALEEHYIFKASYDFALHPEKFIETISLEDIQQLANQVFNTDCLLKAVLYPENYKNKE